MWRSDAAYLGELYLCFWLHRLLRRGIDVLTLAFYSDTLVYTHLFGLHCQEQFCWTRWKTSRLCTFAASRFFLQLPMAFLVPIRFFVALLFWGAADAMPRVELTSWGGLCDKGMNKCDQASLVCRCLASGPI